MAGRVDRKEGALGGGMSAHLERGWQGRRGGEFHRWNAWVEILFPSNAESPS